jgi:hypothetical protein
MHKQLLAAVLTLSFGAIVHAQAPAKAGDTAKPAAPPAGTKPTTPAKDAPPAGAEMAPPKPGPETEALKPFAKSVTSSGTIPAGVMGGNPELTTKGKSTCKWVLNNLWVSCEIEENVGSGKQAMKWAGHWVFGYDFIAKGYRGTMTSTMGDQTQMKGTLEGSKLVWENIEEMKVPGMPSKSRITLDATDPKAIKFSEEGYLQGKWVPMGASVHKVAGK